MANVKGGKRLPKGKNLIKEPNQHPYIRVRDLNNVIYASLNPEYEYVDEETYKTISRYITKKDDVLISIVGTIGLTAIVDNSLNNANLTENCVKITNLKSISPEYLFLFLRSKEGNQAIEKGIVGAVQKKLPLKNIQSITVPLLENDKIENLNKVLKPIFMQIAFNVNQIAYLTELRDALLPKLMSGEIDVSNINI